MFNFFKKRLTATQDGLMNYGYTKNEKYNYVQKNIEIGSCDVHKSKIKGTLIVYLDWGKEKNLPSEYHDQVWKQLYDNAKETPVKSIDSRFTLCSLGFEYISIMFNESDFDSVSELNDLLDKFCKNMTELIKPFLENL